MGFIRFFINQIKVMNIIIVFIILYGGYIFWQGQKEGFPNVNFDIILVSTVYTGASPWEVENLVTKKIEDAIEAVDGKKRLTSVSKQGISVVVFEVDTKTDIPISEIVNDIQSAVDSIQSDLPSDLTSNPLVKELRSTEFPVLAVFFTGNVSDTVLHQVYDKFEADVRNIKSISRVDDTAYLEREVWVEVDPTKLKQYDVAIGDVMTAIRMRNVSQPGGTMTLKGEEYLIRTLGEYKHPKQIAETIIRANAFGRLLRVKDVAKVNMSFEERDKIIKINGEKGIRMNIIKKKTGDIIKTCDGVKNLIEQYKEDNLIPAGMQISYADDLSFYVKRRLGVLTQNATLGLVLVALCLVLFIDLRTTFWTTIGIPVALCLAMIIVNATGGTLNLISMFGFIIVIGMLVDDAIIVAENIYRHAEMGKPPLQAAIEGTHEVLVPITGMIATTIVAFAPIMLLAGIMGKFLFFIPVVVIITIFASYLECLVILPGHLVHKKGSKKLTDKDKKNLTATITLGGKIMSVIFIPIKTIYEAFACLPRKIAFHFKFLQKNTEKPSTFLTRTVDIIKRRAWFNKLQDYYVVALKLFLKQPMVTMVFVTIGCLVLVAALMRFVPFVLFPGSVDEIAIEIEMSTSASLEETERALDKIEAMVKEHHSDIMKELILIAGEGTDGGPGVAVTGNNIGHLRCILKLYSLEDKEKEKAVKLSLNEKMKDIPNIDTYQVTEVRGGPPRSKPVSVQIFGDDFEVIEKIATEVFDEVKAISNTTSVSSSVKRGKKEFLISINEYEAATLGVSTFAVAGAVRNAFEGGVATVAKALKGFDEEIDVVVKYPTNKATSKKEIRELAVKNNSGQNISLDRFTSTDENVTINLINREERQRYIGITAELINPRDKSFNAVGVNRVLAEKVKELKKNYPNNRIKLGGEQEDNEEQVRSATIAMILAMIGVFIILTAMLRSYLQPFVIMLAIPFAFVGVVIGLFITGTPLGLMPMLGMVALTGVVVNDSMVLVVFVNKKRREGMDIKTALIEGGKMRLRPILLTTFTTISGLFPLACGILGKEPFLAPMAIAMIWGLAFSTLIILLVIPSIYYSLEVIMIAFYRSIGKKYQPY